MNKEIKAAVIGAGRMGQYHANVYFELPQVELAAVVDPNEKAGRAVAERYGAQYYKDYKEIFGKVDIASVAVPTSKHFEVGKEMLEEGVHLLLEKPITNNLEKARHLFDIAGKKNLTLHIGHVERFNGAVQELKKVVTQPLLIESRRLGPYDPRIQDDGVVMDLMIHDIDIVLNLVPSKVVKLSAMGQSVFSNKEDIANIQLEFENGCVATLTASRATQDKIRTLSITQKDKYILLDYSNQDINIHRQASSEHFMTKEELRYKQESFTERIFVHKDNPLKLEIKHLIDCATNGAKRVVSVDDELYSLQIALEVMEKLKEHGGNGS